MLGRLSLKEKLAEFEKASIEGALCLSDGNIDEAAEMLDINILILISKMKKHGLYTQG